MVKKQQQDPCISHPYPLRTPVSLLDGEKLPGNFNAVWQVNRWRAHYSRVPRAGGSYPTWWVNKRFPGRVTSYLRPGGTVELCNCLYTFPNVVTLHPHGNPSGSDTRRLIRRKLWLPLSELLPQVRGCAWHLLNLLHLIFTTVNGSLRLQMRT